MKSNKIFEKCCLAIVLLLMISCSSDSAPKVENIPALPETKLVKKEIEKKPPPRNTIYLKDRTKIKERLQRKIKNKEPLLIHTFVPLCDNDNQGIVPVNKSLGDGFNLRTNLYWGALYVAKEQTNLCGKKSELIFNLIPFLLRLIFHRLKDRVFQIILRRN